MNKFTKQEIAQIRANINNGTIYCGISHNRGVGRIFLTSNGNIGWEHFGGATVGNTDHDLEWLLTHIFDDCETVTPAKWSDYHINYVPIDKTYQGIDYSTSHPNVCGV